LGHKREFKSILPEGPLSGAKRKLGTLEITNLKDRSRPKAATEGETKLHLNA